MTMGIGVEVGPRVAVGGNSVGCSPEVGANVIGNVGEMAGLVLTVGVMAGLTAVEAIIGCISSTISRSISVSVVQASDRARNSNSLGPRKIAEEAVAKMGTPLRHRIGDYLPQQSDPMGVQQGGTMAPSSTVLDAQFDKGWV